MKNWKSIHNEQLLSSCTRFYHNGPSHGKTTGDVEGHRIAWFAARCSLEETGCPVRTQRFPSLAQPVLVHGVAELVGLVKLCQGVAQLGRVRHKNAKQVGWVQGQVATGLAIYMRIGQMARGPD